MTSARFSRGFLFTISMIMFSSTLVFFAQTYAGMNAANEASISSSARPLNASFLNDNISFGISRILAASLDANVGAAADSNAQLLLSGTLSSSPSVSSALSYYDANLSQRLFPLVSGTKSIDLSGLKDNKAEAFFGSSFEFDYNYASTVLDVFPLAKNSLKEIDVNLRTYKDLNGFVWLSGPASGSTALIFAYNDDSNYFSVSLGVDSNSLSTLRLVYADSNIDISFGNTRADANSALKISDYGGQKADYSIRAVYSYAMPFPIDWNALLHYSDRGFDGNSFLIIRK